MNGPTRLAGLTLGCLLAVTSAGAQAQASTAHARQVFAATNQQLSHLQRVPFTSRRPGVDYPAEGKAWFDGPTVKKIEVVERDDSGDVVSEFYFDGTELVFILVAVRGFADAGSSGKQVTRLEERYYFRGGKMFKWLSGMGNAQSDTPPSSAEFADAARMNMAAADVFMKAAQQARSTRKLP